MQSYHNIYAASTFQVLYSHILTFKEFEAKSKILSLLLCVELIEIEMCPDNMQLLEVF
jgi:hypothetical protein